MQSTTLKIAQSKVDANRTLPEKIGRYSKQIDAALPGKHTKQLYDQVSWKEAIVLAQLRTGMARQRLVIVLSSAVPSLGLMKTQKSTILAGAFYGLKPYRIWAVGHYRKSTVSILENRPDRKTCSRIGM